MKLGKFRLSKKSLNQLSNMLEIRLKRSRLLSRPVFLTAEPTDACNSRCIMCNKRKLYCSPQFKPGFMSREIFEKILPWASYASSFCWGGFGEPFLHPSYADWAEDLKDSGAKLLCFTNAISLKKELAEKLVKIQFDNIVISIGGATAKTYKYIRGVNGFHSMLENLAYLNAVKAAHNSALPVIDFNLVAMNTVLPELNDVIRLAHEHKVRSVAMPDLNLQYEENVQESIWNNMDEARKYIESAQLLAGKLGVGLVPPTLDEKKGDCRDFFSLIQIAYDGTVLSCPMEKYTLGSLKHETLSRIWNKAEYRKLRKSYFKEGLCVTCPHCVEWDKSRTAMLRFSVDLRAESK